MITLFETVPNKYNMYCSKVNALMAELVWLYVRQTLNYPIFLNMLFKCFTTFDSNFSNTGTFREVELPYTITEVVDIIGILRFGRN